MTEKFEKFPHLLFGPGVAYYAEEVLGDGPVPIVGIKEYVKPAADAQLKAKENHKRFIDSIVQSKASSINGKPIKAMKGVNYNNLKFWNDKIRSGKSDFTKHIVWAYKILGEAIQATLL